MCGIAGHFAFDQGPSPFASLFASIAHRGPDGAGVFTAPHLELGMNRLHFRGRSEPLPVRLDDGGVCAFNGQIFGAFDAAAGFKPSDGGVSGETALLANAETVDGMFAWAKYCPDAQEVTLATDAYFIKPLFARSEADGVSFCSEVAPLLKGRANRVDGEALAELFSFGWYLSDRSWISNLNLVWKNDIKISPAGARFAAKSAKDIPSPGANVSALRAALRSSVERSVQGRGPLGLALSGGLDSTILAHELNALGVEDLICVSVRVDGEEEDPRLEHLHLPAGGAWRSWRQVVVDFNDCEFESLFAEAVRRFGQPSTMSSLPLYLKLASAAAEAGVRALLLGEGADELFGGYSSYAKMKGRTPISYYGSPARDALVAALFDASRVARTRSRFEALYENAVDLRRIEIDLRLSRLLLRSDVCLMAHGVEGRTPFLYNGVPALALAFEWEHLIAAPGKMALRQAYAKDLGERAFASKVRFKAPDAMLKRNLIKMGAAGRFACLSPLFASTGLAEALALAVSERGFDADIACLLMSLALLGEEGAYHGDA